MVVGGVRLPAAPPDHQIDPHENMDTRKKVSKDQAAIMRRFLQRVSRMKTSSEFEEEALEEELSDGDCMSGDDAVETLSNLIEEARSILAIK